MQIVLHLSGNVRFVTKGNPVGPVSNAKVALSNLPGYKTQTDQDGNFVLQLPTNMKLKVIELQITLESGTSYHEVDTLKMENVTIEIETEYNKTDKISGTWEYRCPKNSEEPEKWIIEQNGNELNIKARFEDKGEPYAGTGNFNPDTGDFDFKFIIPMKGGKSKKLSGKGKIKDNMIIGHYPV
ncbi:MAG: hypothetical protein GY749_18685 [Desulfobacteraceae bacterium]|nr:hypothetical protein [Desulfobacteraceae bacterium]